MQDEILEAIRNPFLLVYISILLSFCMVNGSQQIGDAVELELVAYRLQQYEMYGNIFGSKNFKVQYEAVSLDSKALRRCVVTSWRDIANKELDSLLSTSVGALLIIVPSDLDALSPADKTLFSNLERRLSLMRTELAIYVSSMSSETNAILSEVLSSSDDKTSATQQLLKSIVTTSFQFTSTGSSSANPISYRPNNIIGAAPGSDSNGSGVVMLLELLAIFRKFYEKSATRPPYNLVFVWTAGGKYNYQGVRQWIDDFQEGNNERIELAICIEAVGRAGDLIMHASKQPTDESAAGRLLRRLRVAAPNQSVELVTKKINTLAPLSWEHERFNIKKLPAVTLTRLRSHDDDSRKSMFDTPSQLNLEVLEHNIRIVAEAVLGHILSLPEDGFSNDSRVAADTSILSREAVDRQRLAHFIRQFVSRPRPLGDEAATQAVSANIASAVSSYTKVTISPVTLQDVQVWSVVSEKLIAERVKPAAFDMIIASGVCAYIAFFYHIITNAQRVLEYAVLRLKKKI
uniref:BOS complex subunit NCLN n=1 Tax=Heterorhabditis bacteriophora TaxID=37862 RepID=A0A1I7XHY7_HETBA